MMAVSKRTRFEVLRRDNHTCRYCRSTENPLTVDHVTPVALGGSDAPDNLVAACRDCNAGKSSSSPDAETVADVSEDAARWAAAMRSAFAETSDDLVRRREYIDRFDNAWGKFQTSGGTVPKPRTYVNTVGHWFQIEVPFEVVEYAIERAMGNDRIYNDAVFKYMCGIVWRKVEEARAKAEQTIRDGVVADG